MTETLDNSDLAENHIQFLAAFLAEHKIVHKIHDSEIILRSDKDASFKIAPTHPLELPPTKLLDRCWLIASSSHSKMSYLWNRQRAQKIKLGYLKKFLLLGIIDESEVPKSWRDVNL